jgi:hypothetical protein
MTERLGNLCKTIEGEHACKAKHAGSIYVTEMDGLRKIWQGTVEVFLLQGHPQAKICYGWSEGDGKEDKQITVLEVPPVTSPQSAVRAAIARPKKK